MGTLLYKSFPALSIVCFEPKHDIGNGWVFACVNEVPGNHGPELPFGPFEMIARCFPKAALRSNRRVLTAGIIQGHVLEGALFPAETSGLKRGFFEQAFIFAAELGKAFIADPMGGISHTYTFEDDQGACSMQTQPFDILQG